MRHISHRSGIGTLLFLMLSTVGCGLLLAGCGPKLPDSGSLDPVEVRKETPFYLDVSAEMVQEQGICADGLAAAIEKRLLTVDGMKPADKPGPGALTVRVDVRDVYRPGRTRKNYLKSAGAAIALATLGTVGGAVTGAFSAPHCTDTATSTALGGFIGAASGATSGFVYGLSLGEPKEIWAIRAGVGVAWDEQPEKLEEIVVSTGSKGVRTHEEAVSRLEARLAQRIGRAFTARPQSP